jgi:hypothetical protein
MPMVNSSGPGGLNSFGDHSAETAVRWHGSDVQAAALQCVGKPHMAGVDTHSKLVRRLIKAAKEAHDGGVWLRARVCCVLRTCTCSPLV